MKNPRNTAKTAFLGFLISMKRYPNRLICLSRSSLMILIFFPSMAITCSLAKVVSVRIAFEVVMFERFAKSSRER